MKKLLDFIHKERLYFLLIIFILEVNVALLSPEETGGKAKARKTPQQEAVQAEKGRGEKGREELFMKREEVEELLKKKPQLALMFSLSSLLITMVLLLGIAIDTMLVSSRFSKKAKPDIATYKGTLIRWGIWDVAKVVILFLFFGYIIMIIESLLARSLPVLKNENFRMIFNSSLLDILAIVFIVYFAVGQHRDKLISLGISLKNFSRNVFYGIIGYIAAVPILVGLLVIIAAVLNILKYVPPKQPVVDLFLKEKDVAFLAYTSLFAAIVGPVIEELFFRGFMYNAFKKYIGVFWAMFFTAAVFAGLHAHLVGFLPILALGMVLAYMYEKTGTLVSSVTIHIIHNMGMVFLVFLVKQLKV